MIAHSICQEQALYSLFCAGIPDYAIQDISCVDHKSINGSKVKILKCALFQDKAMHAGCEDVDSWNVSYHGTSAEAARSILKHGQLLMEGDVLSNGEQLVAANHKKKSGELSYFWTTPSQDAAEKYSSLAQFDDEKTQMKFIFQCRQETTSYEISDDDLLSWKSNRRNSVFFEALIVIIYKTDNVLPMLETSPMKPLIYSTNFTCAIQNRAYQFLETLNMPKAMFNGNCNRCYCSKCYKVEWPDSMNVGGKLYVIPRGWVRFGLAVDEVFARINNIWNEWNIAYHGCPVASALSIIKHRSLLVARDIKMDGTAVPVHATNENHKMHKGRQTRYFLSPSIGYASHTWYADPTKFTTNTGRVNHAQVVLMFKVKPESFTTNGHTERNPEDDYSIIAEDEIEWKSDRRGCVHPYGILIRTLDEKEFAALKSFDSPQPTTTNLTKANSRPNCIIL